MSHDRPVGQTSGAGWEIGVSRTLPHSIGHVWEFLTSGAGTEVWLGHGAHPIGEVGQTYETDDGTVGETRSAPARDRIRLTWQPEDWDHDTTVQVAVTAKGDDRTIVTFHQERLADKRERERQREHWRTVIDAVAEALGDSN